MATSLKDHFKTDAIFVFGQFIFVTLKVNILLLLQPVTPSKHWSQRVCLKPSRTKTLRSNLRCDFLKLLTYF